MKILVIEDEERIANFLRSGLEDEGYDVDMELDGIAGYQTASENTYSVIILDLMLPGKNGLDILKDLRSNKVFTPVLILTARGEIDEKVEGLNLGADDYLAKPFNFDEVKARVNALIRRSDPQMNTTLVYQDLELDTVHHTAKRGDRAIELTSKEYLLIEFLMRNKNKPVSRDEIWQSVWPEKDETDSNIIDVYVKRIRTKIGSSEYGTQLINSIRGVGYILGGKK